MDYYKVYRVETDGVVATVIVACCQKSEKYYAEYCVLYEELQCSPPRLLWWHDHKEVSKADADKILGYALGIAKTRMIQEGLQLGNGLAYGDNSDIDALSIQHRNDIAKLHDTVKCQCLKSLLNTL